MLLDPHPLHLDPLCMSFWFLLSSNEDIILKTQLELALTLIIDARLSPGKAIRSRSVADQQCFGSGIICFGI